MDALTAVLSLLKPQAIGIKIIRAGGRWSVRYPAFEHPGFALVLRGACSLHPERHFPTTLNAGGFLLFPAHTGLVMASDANVKPARLRSAKPDRHVHDVSHGDPTTEPALTMLAGYFAFDPINTSLLLNFLPKILRVCADDSAGGSSVLIIDSIRREALVPRPGRALILIRLVEVLLVEALRSFPAALPGSGLLGGYHDPHLAAALRAIHTQTAHPWTLATLAREAAMSRSFFAERFARMVGKPPLDYLLQWRLAVAKKMLARDHKSGAETALATGYESARGFSTVFSREIGMSPKEFTATHRVREPQSEFYSEAR